MEQVGYFILAVALIVAFLYISNRTWRKGNYWGMNFDRGLRALRHAQADVPVPHPAVQGAVAGRMDVQELRRQAQPSWRGADLVMSRSVSAMEKEANV